MINTMLSEDEYPNPWKMAQTVPIPKVKQPSISKKFRPVSLIFHLEKVAEQVSLNIEVH